MDEARQLRRAAPAIGALSRRIDEGNSTDLESLWQPVQAKERTSVDQLLLERGQITEEQLDQARKVQQQTPGKTLAQVLLTMNAATEAQILSALAETMGIPFETPQKADIDPRAFELLSPDYIRKQFVLPLRFEDEDCKILVVGM